MPETRVNRVDTAAVAIAASFTAEPLLPPLELTLASAGLRPALQLAPYHQIFQQLLSPDSLLATHVGAANVLLVRLEDFVRDIDEPRRALDIIERTGRELASAIAEFAARSRAPLITLVLPVSPLAAEALEPALRAATARLLEELNGCAALHRLASDDIERLCSGERHDRLRDELAHIPYTEEYYGALALALARKIHALCVPAHKVLALDCDNTLWSGVVGEDGVEGIDLAEGHLQLQRFAIQAQASGALICLASKNAERDVIEVFDRRADMPLRLEHIIAHRINWKSKPENIASLARELNLGLDSFVFLDDNPIECAQMRAELPQVLTLQLPPEPQIAAFLANLWAFDKPAVTTEDARRTSLYRENLARQASESAAGNIAHFMASLELVIDIDTPAPDEWQRVAQLTQRTNQFNFTTVRRSEAELHGVQNEGGLVLRVRVRDRFGDYGLVGVMIARPTPPNLLVDTLLLSCRVLGRGVEHAMLRRLGELARDRQLAHVDLPYLQTARNEPAQAFADSVAAANRFDDQGRVLYRIAATHACGIQHRPGHDPAAVINARQAEEAKAAASSLSSADGGLSRVERYSKLAEELTCGRAVLETLRLQGRRTRPLPGRALPATNDTERRLLALWQELLNINELGVDDNYFALGGTSLLAARMFAEITRRFGVRLRLTTIITAPTVRALARQLQPQLQHLSQQPEHHPVLIELKGGGPLTLFLVHDGDGETLLYRSLAQRLPEALAVYGIEPRRLPNVPLALGSIAEMAGFYVAEMRRQQPHGPYWLGGLCAGGIIAYEMARQLQAAGESVELVALLDAARPGAAKRAGRIARERAKRFEQMISTLRQTQATPLARLPRLLAGSIRKLANLTHWIVRSRAQKLSVAARFALLRRLLAAQRPWPAGVAPLSVRDIYDHAESRYVPGALSGAGVLLLRARAEQPESNDTPYRLIYEDETLGWRAVVPDLEVLDAEGGHSSMLQEPYVGSLAAALTRRLFQKSEGDLPRVRAAW